MIYGMKHCDKAVINAAEKRKNNVCDIDTTLSTIADLYRKAVEEIETRYLHPDKRPPICCGNYLEKQFMPKRTGNSANRYFSRFITL